MEMGSDMAALGFSLMVLIVALGLRVWLGKRAWSFHPQGAKGYIRDEAINMLALLIPAVLIGLGLRYLAMRSGPNEQSLYLALALGVVLVLLFVRRGVNYVPFFKDSAARIKAARKAVYDTKGGASS
jgi:hypothetical protein